MRLVKVLGIVICILSLVSMVIAGPKNSMGVREVSHVSFSTPVHVGTALLPAGEYVVRHTMEGQDHIMVFQLVHGKDTVKAKCTLVPLEKKAERDQVIYELTAGNGRVLQELVFRGDTAKHVF
jgi:hypothetical protein